VHVQSSSLNMDKYAKSAAALMPVPSLRSLCGATSTAPGSCSPGAMYIAEPDCVERDTFERVLGYEGV
jgi:hypothetical protein